MAQQGAALQNYNNELVKCLDELCERRQKLQREIDREEKERQTLDEQIASLQSRRDKVDANLRAKIQTRTEYDRTIKESEQAYMKILESSQVLLNVVKRDAVNLQKSESAVVKRTTTK